MFFFLVFEWVKPHYAFLGAALILFFTGCVSFVDFANGFMNQSVVTIACLFIVITGIQRSTSISMLSDVVFKKSKSNSRLTLRFMFIVSSFSAFLNNTPIVLLFSPLIKKWGYLNNHPPSKLLIPLSYGAILGGMCTLIGTSTNLIVHAMLEQNDYSGFSMFELGLVGVPSAIAGILYMSFIGYKHLPELPLNESERLEYSSLHNEKRSLSFRDMLAYGLFIVMIILVSLQVISTLFGAIGTSILFIVTRIISIKKAFTSIPWSLLIVIGAAIGLGTALETSGAAQFITEKFITPVSLFGPIPLLIAIFLITSIITELITNNAAAVFIFPIALFIAEQMSYNFESFAVAIAIAASTSFATPIGYQTNLIVYEYGNYHFKHFFITGLPLKIIVMIISILLIPIFWPLT